LGQAQSPGARRGVTTLGCLGSIPFPPTGLAGCFSASWCIRLACILLATPFASWVILLACILLAIPFVRRAVRCCSVSSAPFGALPSAVFDRLTPLHHTALCSRSASSPSNCFVWEQRSHCSPFTPRTSFICSPTLPCMSLIAGALLAGALLAGALLAAFAAACGMGCFGWKPAACFRWPPPWTASDGPPPGRLMLTIRTPLNCCRGGLRQRLFCCVSASRSPSRAAPAARIGLPRAWKSGEFCCPCDIPGSGRDSRPPLVCCPSAGPQSSRSGPKIGFRLRPRRRVCPTRALPYRTPTTEACLRASTHAPHVSREPHTSHNAHTQHTLRATWRCAASPSRRRARSCARWGRAHAPGSSWRTWGQRG